MSEIKQNRLERFSRFSAKGAVVGDGRPASIHHSTASSLEPAASSRQPVCSAFRRAPIRHRHRQSPTDASPSTTVSSRADAPPTETRRRRTRVSSIASSSSSSSSSSSARRREPVTNRSSSVVISNGRHLDVDAWERSRERETRDVSMRGVSRTVSRQESGAFAFAGGETGRWMTRDDGRRRDAAARRRRRATTFDD